MDNKINVRLLSMVGQGGSAFGIGLMNLMEKRDDIVVLSPDMSTPAGLDKFKAAYPERFINVGIAEQNMIGMAAGLADEGFKPICVAQACFITMRSFEPIRQYCGYMELPIVLVGIGSGFSLQYMGNTHYALEDIALMKTVPGMVIEAPCDSLEAMKSLEAAVDSNQPVYIRMFGGTGIPTVHQDNINYEMGKAINIRDGKDVCIVATGSMVNNALQASKQLSEEKGIECKVLDMHTIHPLDVESIKGLVNYKLIVTVEEHRDVGGLGSSVRDAMADVKNTPPHISMAVQQAYPAPGSYPYMLKEVGLDVENIVKTVINNMP